MSRLRVRLAFFALVALSLASCRTLAMSAFAQPEITFQDVRIAQLSLSGGTLDVVIGVRNPNGYRLDARRVSYRLMTDSTELGRGVLEKAISINPRDSAVVTLPLSFTFAALGAVARQLQSKGAIEYRVLGDLQVATPVGSFTRPYDQKGTFTLFQSLRNGEKVSFQDN